MALSRRKERLPGRPPVALALPVVLAQTFRAIIHSRMTVGMAKYDHDYPGADVILFEPGRDDVLDRLEGGLKRRSASVRAA